MCLSCICLLAMHTLICVTFSLPPGVRGWLRLLLVALPGFFYLPFLYGYITVTVSKQKHKRKNIGVKGGGRGSSANKLQ